MYCISGILNPFKVRILRIPSCISSFSHLTLVTHLLPITVPSLSIVLVRWSPSHLNLGLLYILLGTSLQSSIPIQLQLHLFSNLLIMSATKLAAVTAMFGTAFAAYTNSTGTNSTSITLNLAPEYYSGTVPIEGTSVAGNLDGFKMLNSSPLKYADFWYFDVFSQATNQTLNIVFFNTDWFSQYSHPLAVQVSGVYPNGMAFYYEALADNGVTLTSDEDGITGD